MQQAKTSRKQSRPPRWARTFFTRAGILLLLPLLALAAIYAEIRQKLVLDR